MKARGKREAKRSASSLVRENDLIPALKARNTRDISAFQALFDRAYRNQGRRASRLPLANIFRAVGASTTPVGARFRLLRQTPVD
jgi:hypothetical protein